MASRNLTTPGPQASMHIDTLVPYTNYSWSVAAVTVAAGPASERLQFTTLVDGRLLGPHCSPTLCNED